MNEDETDEFEDLQESRELELQEFEPSPRLTEADAANDMRSLERRLDRVLYLLVKKPRKDHQWQMPQGGVEEKESLLEVHSTLKLMLFETYFSPRRQQRENLLRSAVHQRN